MIDEEKAREYCGCNQPICRKGFETKDKQICTCARKQIYLDGLEEGRKELEQWKQEWQDAQIKANEEGFARTTLQIKYKDLEKEEIELTEILKDKDRQLNNWFLSYNEVLKENAKLKAESKDWEIWEEGRKKEIEELSNSVTELTNTKTELENKVTELEKQIQRMKCCGNCKYCEISEDWALFCTKDDRGAFRPYHCDSWELWEKKE